MQRGEELGRVAEEIANSVTHGVGLGLSLAGFAVLLVLADQRDDPWYIVSCGIYGLTLVALYAASTLYHSFYDPRLKRILRIVDHSAIYLLIAGTCTPFMLIDRNGWGWRLCAVVWSLAVAGVAYKIFFIERFPRLSTLLYVVKGWMIFLAMLPLLSSIPTTGILLLLAGGVFYTSGVWFYAREPVPYSHAIWHLFVLLGSGCHYMAVLVSVLSFWG